MVRLVLPCALVLSLAAVFPAPAAPFTPGDAVVYRVGDGFNPLVNSGNAVFLDEYAPDGTLVQSVAMPQSTSFGDNGLNYGLVASGVAVSEGQLNLSPDGQYLTVTGYSSAATNLNGTTSAAVPRTIGVVNAAGVVDTTTSLNDYANLDQPRSAITTDGVHLWAVGGSGGVRYATLGSTTSTALNTTAPTNLRDLDIIGGQLYGSTQSGTAVRLVQIGTGLPTTGGQSLTNIPGYPLTGTGSTLDQFFFLDLSAAVPGPDTLYVADDTAGLLKFSLVGGAWSLVGQTGNPTAAFRGLGGYFDGTKVVMYATANGGTGASGGGTLFSLIDTAGYNNSFSNVPTLIASADFQEAFRGVAMAPSAIPEPSVLGALLLGGSALGLVRRRRR